MRFFIHKSQKFIHRIRGVYPQLTAGYPQKYCPLTALAAALSTGLPGINTPAYLLFISYPRSYPQVKSSYPQFLSSYPQFSKKKASFVSSGNLLKLWYTRRQSILRADGASA